MSDDDELCDECGQCKARKDGKCWYCVQPVNETNIIDVFDGEEVPV